MEPFNLEQSARLVQMEATLDEIFYRHPDTLTDEELLEKMLFIKESALKFMEEYA